LKAVAHGRKEFKMKLLTSDRTHIGEWLRLAFAGVFLIAVTAVAAQQPSAHLKASLTGTS